MRFRNAVICMALMAVSALSGPVHAAGKDCSDESNFPEVSGEELERLVAGKSATVIDVNSEDSFKKIHVTGAIHYGSNKKNLAKVLPSDKGALIVAYCGGPQCTAWERAAEEACEAGYTNIRHYKGGLKDWKERSKKS